jgi:hypothetical protein
MKDQFTRWSSGLLAALLTAAPMAASAGDMAGNCRMGNQPAATLLVPYFEADLNNVNGANTLVSVNNATSRPVLARMVLWTDWGIPTLAFDIYLTGYDVQTYSLRDVFNGTLPLTGPGISPTGPYSQGGDESFPGCANAMAAISQVGFNEQRYLRAAHTGRALPNVQPTQCAASYHRPAAVTGYITIDVVNHCSPPTVASTANTPADPAYFVKGGTGVASDVNALWGDVILVNPQLNQATSQPALALLADSSFFQSGDYTFYGRYSEFDSRDDRMPLSSLYYVRFFNGGPFSGGTELLVWRDTRAPDANPVPCGSSPFWSPPGEEQVVMFDEQENAVGLTGSNVFPLATQRVKVGGAALPAPSAFGWLMLDLWRADGTHAQGWVGSLLSGGHFSAGHEALRADDLCTFGP